MAQTAKQPYIAFFEEYFNYMDDLNPEQYFQFMTLIRNLRWRGIDTLPEDVTDKDVRLAWRSIRPSIAKSRRNAGDHQNRKNNLSTYDIEPNKDFEEEKPIDVPQEPSIAPEQPKNDYTDTSNYQEKTWDIYEPNENAFKTLYIKLKEHPSTESREEAKKEIRDIILMYGFDNENEYTNVKREINSLLREWYVKNYQQTA